MKFLKDHLMLALGLGSIVDVPDCWVLNCYADAAKHIDWHADDDDLFDAVEHEAVIVSLSFGADGLFAFRC